MADLDALAALRRSLPAECKVTVQHAAVHLRNALYALGAVTATGPDIDQALHDAELAHRILTLLRFGG